MMEQLEENGEIKLCLVLLCGLPGAGKTSLAVSLKETGNLSATSSSPATDDAGRAIIHLCYDDIIPRQLEMEMKGGERPIEPTNQSSASMSPWKAYRQEIVHCVDGILARLKSDRSKVLDEGIFRRQGLSQIGKEVRSKMLTLIQDQQWISSRKQPEPLSAPPTERRHAHPASSNVVLIIDDNMYYRSMRYEYYQLARKYGTGFCQLYLHCSAEVAVERDRQRRLGIPEETIRKMASKIEAPDQQVASWERRCIHVDAEDMKNQTTMSAIWDLISESLLDPVCLSVVENTKEKEASRAVCAASVIHRADQTLRKCVAEAMKAAKDGALLTKAELGTLGSKFNSIRQTVLQKIRDCKVHPPPLIGTEIDRSHVVEGGSDFDAFVRELFEKVQLAS